jgi:cytochrome c551/c552
MKNKFSVLIFLVTIISAKTFSKDVSIDDGKTIFSSRCAACHNVNIKLVGPALAGVDQRHSIDWIINFVHSSQTLVKKNDKDAVALFNEFNNIVMPDHPDLSTDQIKSIVEFVKSQAIGKSSDEAPFPRPGRLQPIYVPVSISNFTFFGIYVVMIFLMVACLVIAVKVKELQRENENRKQEN